MGKLLVLFGLLICVGCSRNEPEPTSTRTTESESILCEMTKPEAAYALRARSWGLSDVDFQRLRHAWTVTRRSTDERLSKVIGNERCAQLGKTMLNRIDERGLSLYPDRAIEVDQLYRECCAELMLGLENVELEKQVIKLWLLTMKV